MPNPANALTEASVTLITAYNQQHPPAPALYSLPINAALPPLAAAAPQVLPLPLHPVLLDGHLPPHPLQHRQVDVGGDDAGGVRVGEARDDGAPGVDDLVV